MLKSLAIATGLLLMAALPGYSAETRCGWLQNPTPGNWWLTDADATWTISAQGGYRARGMDNIPDISTGQYVRTNGYYGYGCACLEVTVDWRRSRISRIDSVEQLPLKQCRQDRNLPPAP